MKKILLAFDGTHFSNGAFQFARELNELEPALVTGAFLIVGGLASGNEVFQRLLSIGWPVVLIFIGLLLLASAFGFTGRRHD